MITNSTQRFSTRVEDYVKYRPGYPREILDLLLGHCGLSADSVVADVGSGTGIFSEMLLDAGAAVRGVEPNPEMRAAAERLLAGHLKFTSVAGTAEVTTLPNASVDFVTAAQAFHWFSLSRTRLEVARILRPGGWIVLIWNDRQIDSTPFLRDYEALLQRFATDYAEVRRKELDLEKVRAFVGSGAVKSTVFKNRQIFDYNGLLGRLMSSSYAPEPVHPNHQPMRQRLNEIFRRHQVAGKVAIEYDTQVYTAQLTTG